MKKIRKISSLFLVMILTVTFLAGCSGNKNSSPISKKPEEKPSFTELVKAFKNTDVKYYVNTLKEHMSDLDKIEITDVPKFMSEITKTFGNIQLPNSDSKYTNIADLGKLSSYPSTTKGTNDAIVIIKDATLHRTSTSVSGVKREVKEKINIVALQGTEFVENQATGFKEDILAGMELNNYYLYDAFLAITNNVKKGSTLYITGVSLGGMVAQQLAGVKYLQDNYNVKYVNAISSPLIAPENINFSETKVNRFIIPNDLVPTLSNSATEQTSKENLVIDGEGVYDTFIGAHVFGHASENIWGKYDVLGVKGGDAYITFENIGEISLLPASNKNANMK